MSRSELSPIIRQVESALAEAFATTEKLHLINGVSGGPDSMALLYIFHRLGVTTTVVHCNYQLRGESSDRDQELVEETASLWGFETVSVRLDPEPVDQNFQNWARNRRYRIFRDLKRELNADAIVTAHHQDDQLETIIQKIMRGAGLTAWKGMVRWDGELFRPLLQFSKSDILQFASKHHVPYRLDGSNEESTYARNFLRNGWFPVLDDLFPGWRENLLRIPDRATEHQLLADYLAGSMMPDSHSLDREKFLSLDPEIQSPVLLHVMKTMDESVSVSRNTLLNLNRLDSLQTGKKLQLNNTWSIVRDRGRFVIQKNLQVELPELTIDGSELAGGELIRYSYGFLLTAWDGKIDPDILQLDADKIIWPLKLRGWREGDRIRPFGMDGHKSIADYLTDRKTPSDEKPRVTVLETSDHRICAILLPVDTGIAAGTPGIIADWARCAPDTGTTLQIRPVA